MPKPQLSVVIPVYEEAQNIFPLVSRLTAALEKTVKSYEILFVDDGSKDETWTRLKDVKKRTQAIRAFRLLRNRGKAAALCVGFANARADWIMTLDGDLQDQPEGIPQFWNLRNTYDLLVGWKVHRKDPLHKTIPSLFFNWLTRAMTGVKVHDSNCGMKLLKKSVAEQLWLHGELHRYIPAIAHFQGFRVGEVKIVHAPRKFGRSKYGLSRLIWGFLDLVGVSFLMVFGKRPLHLFGSIGLILAASGSGMGLALTWQWLNGIPLGNRPLLMLSVLLVVLGIQFFSLGLLGELINRRSPPEEIALREKL